MVDKEQAERRAHMLTEMFECNGMPEEEPWAKSPNPLKRRIARLEIAWREVMQGLFEDIRRMFENFVLISDSYDKLDINIASVKSLCVQKGIFTEEEFKERQQYLFGVLDRTRIAKQAELDRLVAQVEAERNVDPKLVRMRKAAEEAENYIPKSATILGGGHA